MDSNTILLVTVQLGWPFRVILNWQEGVFICYTSTNNQVLDEGCPRNKSGTWGKGKFQRRTQLMAACCQHSMGEECFSPERWHMYGTPENPSQVRTAEGRKEEEQADTQMGRERGKRHCLWAESLGQFLGEEQSNSFHAPVGNICFSQRVFSLCQASS